MKITFGFIEKCRELKDEASAISIRCLDIRENTNYILKSIRTIRIYFAITIGINLIMLLLALIKK